MAIAMASNTKTSSIYFVSLLFFVAIRLAFSQSFISAVGNSSVSSVACPSGYSCFSSFRNVTVEWGYNGHVCAGQNDGECYQGEKDPRGFMRGPMQNPVYIYLGDSLFFKTTSGFSIRPFNVSRTTFHRCTPFNDASAIIPSITSSMFEIPSKYINSIGFKYFIANTNNLLFRCDFGVKLEVSVRSASACINPAVQNKEICSSKGLCATAGKFFTYNASCVCETGYVGSYCEEYNSCYNTLNPCKNGGTCVDKKSGLVNNYECMCIVGYTGKNCETNIYDCKPDPCRNGAVCIDGIASYNCLCQPGYHGKNCSDLRVNPCDPNPCENGGTCSLDENRQNYTCKCPDAFEGRNCSSNVTIASSAPMSSSVVTIVASVGKSSVLLTHVTSSTLDIIPSSTQTEKATPSTYITVLPSLTQTTLNTQTSFVGVSQTYVETTFSSLLVTSVASPSSSSVLTSGNFSLNTVSTVNNSTSLPVSTVSTPLNSSMSTSFSTSSSAVSSFKPSVSTIIFSRSSVISSKTFSTTAQITSKSSTNSSIILPSHSTLSLSTSASISTTSPSINSTSTVELVHTSSSKFVITSLAANSTQFSSTAVSSSLKPLTTSSALSSSSSISSSMAYSSKKPSTSTVTSLSLQPSPTLSSAAPSSLEPTTSVSSHVSPASTSGMSTTLPSSAKTAFTTATSSFSLTSVVHESTTIAVPSTVTVLQSSPLLSTETQQTTATTALLSSTSMTSMSMVSSMASVSSKSVSSSSTGASTVQGTSVVETSTSIVEPPTTMVSSATVMATSTPTVVLSSSSIAPTSTASSVVSSSSVVPTTVPPTTIPLLERTCKDNPCNSGTCLDTHDTLGFNFTCQCPKPTYGPRCSTDYKLHFPRFSNSSYLVHKPIAFAVGFNKIVITFKTTEPNGLLFYSTHIKFRDFIQLYLIDGNLEYRFDPGDSLVGIRSTVKVNTGKIVTAVVTYDSNNKEGTLKVDNNEPKKARSQGKFVGIGLYNEWYIGGLPPGKKFRVNDEAKETPTFDGCIKDIELNGDQISFTEAIDWNNLNECDKPCDHQPCHNNGTCTNDIDDPHDYQCKCHVGYDGKNCNKYSVCSGDPCKGGLCVANVEKNSKKCLCPFGRAGINCENDLNITVPCFSMAYNYSSYIQYQVPTRSGPYFAITLQFKLDNTSKASENSLLAFSGQDQYQGKGDDFVALGINNNKVVFQYDLGSGIARISSNVLDKNIEWHSVTAGRSGKAGYLYVDNQPVKQGSSLGELSGLNLYSPLYIGGVPELSDLSNIDFKNGFQGCVSNMAVKFGQTEKLITLLTTQSGSNGWPVVSGRNVGDKNYSACANKNPCQNNGTCVTKGASISCSCVGSWKGMFCSSRDIPCINSNPCASWSTCREVNNKAVCDCPLGKSGPTCTQSLSIQMPRFSENSYMAFNPKTTSGKTIYIRATTNIKITFTPSNANGLLFYVTHKISSQRGDFLSISLHNGFVHYRYDLGSGLAKYQSQKAISLNTLHTVEVNRTSKSGTLKVDSEPVVSETSIGDAIALDVGSNFYLGGLPQLSALNPSAVFDSSSLKDFVGCVSSIEVNGVSLVLTEKGALEGRNIDNCPSSNPVVT